MTGDRIETKILSVRTIPNADRALLRALGVEGKATSLGIMTTDCDDASYAALDEATKKARVFVAYAKSMYAGAPNASTRLAGEFIGILAADDPEEIRSGLEAMALYLHNDAAFESACDDGSIVYFAHCISSTGSYLSELAGVPRGTPMAYLIAPPLEATVGLDAALKAAHVDMKVFYGPPSETNFAGGLLVGDQPDCRAACEAFAKCVRDIAAHPVESLAETYRAPQPKPDKKPEDMTLLRGSTLVPKTDPRIALRGRLDSLEAKIIETAVIAKRAGLRQLASHLNELLLYTRQILAAEVNETPLPDMPLFGMDEERIHYVSHHTKEEIGVGWVIPGTDMCETGAALNALRTEARECELTAVHTFAGARTDIVQALNRLSSAVYILVCRLAAGYYKA